MAAARRRHPCSFRLEIRIRMARERERERDALIAAAAKTRATAAGRAAASEIKYGRSERVSARGRMVAICNAGGGCTQTGRTDMDGRADADMGICFAKADGRLSKEKSIFRSVCLATRLDSSARANSDDVMSASLLRSSPVEVFDAP